MSDDTPAERAALFEAPDDLDAINRLYRERRWSDGLPIVPPTQERVARMLGATRRARDEVVAAVAPGYGAATVERIAINAVLAGCDPEYLPLLIAATEAVAAPEFNLQGIQSTTNPVAVWLIVNGPIAQRLNVNSTFNCLGQGAWANATLGRALRLILQNVGGALPGEMDRATQGQPGKYSFCCAENEAGNPWEPLHVERGFARECSTVTVVGAEGTMNMNSHAKDAVELARVIAETMIHPPSNEYTHGGEPWLVLGPEHAEVFRMRRLEQGGGQAAVVGAIENESGPHECEGPHARGRFAHRGTGSDRARDPAADLGACRRHRHRGRRRAGHAFDLYPELRQHARGDAGSR